MGSANWSAVLFTSQAKPVRAGTVCMRSPPDFFVNPQWARKYRAKDTKLHVTLYLPTVTWKTYERRSREGRMLFQTIELACHSSIDHTIFLANGRVFLTLGCSLRHMLSRVSIWLALRKNFVLPNICSVEESACCGRAVNNITSSGLEALFLKELYD